MTGRHRVVHEMTRQEMLETLKRGGQVRVALADIEKYKNFYALRNSLNCSLLKIGKKVSSRKQADGGWIMTPKEKAKELK